MTTTTMTKQQLRELLDSALAVARVAQIEHRCVTANEFYDFWKVEVEHARSTTATTTRDEPTDESIAAIKRQFPNAAVSVYRMPNPNYRDKQPGCAGAIKPGDLYVEYMGEAPAYGSGDPYCVACGSVIWNKTNWSERA